MHKNSLYWKKNLQKDICGPGGDWQRFKRPPDQIMYGQKFGRKLVKPLRIEKSKNGRKRNRSLTMLESWEGFISRSGWQRIFRNYQNARRKLERPMAPAMPCKRDKQHSSIVKTNVEQKMAVRRSSKQWKLEDRIAGKGFTSMTLYNLVH